MHEALLTWQRMSPGHYRAAMTLEEGDVIRGAVQAGPFAIPFGPLSAGSNVEWMFDTARVEELRQTAAESGGGELLDLKDAWKAPPVTQFTDLRLWLLPVLLGLVLTEALATRLGWSFAELWSRRAKRPAAVAQGRAATPQPTVMASENAGADPGTTPPVSEKNASLSWKPESRNAPFSPTPAQSRTPAPAASSPEKGGAPKAEGGAAQDAAAAERRRERFARAKKGGG